MGNLSIWSTFDSLEQQGAFPLSILREVDIKPIESDYFKFECKEIGGKWYAVPT